MNKYATLYLSAAAVYVLGITLSYFLALTPACGEENSTTQGDNENGK